MEREEKELTDEEAFRGLSINSAFPQINERSCEQSQPEIRISSDSRTRAIKFNVICNV